MSLCSLWGQTGVFSPGRQTGVVTLVGHRIIPTVNYARPVTITLYATHTTRLLSARPRGVRIHLDTGVLGGTVNINVPNAKVVNLPVTITLNTLINHSRCQLRILHSIAPRTIKQNTHCVSRGHIYVSLGRSVTRGLCVRIRTSTKRHHTITIVTNKRATFICLRHSNRILLSGHATSITRRRTNRIPLALHHI